jgi:hypothetical protein
MQLRLLKDNNSFTLINMTPEQKLTLKGLSAVGIILAAAGVVLAFFFVDMAQNALMGESDRFRPRFPEVPVTNISEAPQCAPGYDKTWIGCQSLAQ